jgi:hypothetical protein
MNTTKHTRPSTHDKALRGWALTLLAAPVLVLALAGCTPAASDGATSNPDGAAASAGSDAEMSSARDAYDRKLAECFRAQGLDVKDPLPGKGITEDSPEIQEAYPVCAAEIGDPPSNAGMKLSPEDLDKLLERATCLREMGYEIQEPTVDDPGFIPAEVSEEDFATCEA